MEPAGGVQERLDADPGTGDHGVTGSGLEERLHAQQDASYSTTALVNTSGVVQEQFVYDPYGQTTVLSASWSSASDGYAWKYLHQGGRRDSTTGLSHFRFRDHSASLGRWTRNDPIGYLDGLNRYEFVASNPVSSVDPLGLQRAQTGSPISTQPSWQPGLGYGTVGPDGYKPAPNPPPPATADPGDPNYDPGTGGSLGGALDGLQAWADGINPFGDPFANNGFYDPNDGDLGFAQWMGVTSGLAWGTAAGLGPTKLGRFAMKIRLHPPHAGGPHRFWHVQLNYWFRGSKGVPHGWRWPGGPFLFVPIEGGIGQPGIGQPHEQ